MLKFVNFFLTTSLYNYIIKATSPSFPYVSHKPAWIFRFKEDTCMSEGQGKQYDFSAD